MAADINGQYPGEHIRARHVSKMPPPPAPRARVGCFWWAIIAVLILAIAAGATKAGGLW